MVRLWLKAFGKRRVVDKEIFKDYDGVEKNAEPSTRRGYGMRARLLLVRVLRARCERRRRANVSEPHNPHGLSLCARRRHGFFCAPDRAEAFPRRSASASSPTIVRAPAGVIGADVVAKSAPDGYTLLMSSPSPLVVSPHLLKSMPYDPQKDLAPVVWIAAVPAPDGRSSVDTGEDGVRIHQARENRNRGS